MPNVAKTNLIRPNTENIITIPTIPQSIESLASILPVPFSS